MRILKISSLPSAKESWVDRDVIILHSCFQLLKDCVEKEEVLEHCNYEAHKDSIDEVRLLYNWWLQRNTPNEVETGNDTEDDEMLLRLIKIKNFLWT